MVNLGGIDEAEPLGELDPLPDQRLSHPLVGHRRLHEENLVHLCNLQELLKKSLMDLVVLLLQGNLKAVHLGKD